MAPSSEEPRMGKHGKAPVADPAPRRRSVAILVAIVALCVVAAGACIGYIAWNQHQMELVAQKQEAAPEPQTQEPAAEAEADARVENPIDFATLQQQNADIYAWLYIPNTSVNLPVLQSASDDNYYLDHNADGEYSIEGAAFSQSMNAKDFSDPVTLIYGHQTTTNAIFTTLHRFEDADFFAANSEMYIYTPGHILTYEIIAAYQYDDRHILNSFDFNYPGVIEKYFETVLNPTSMLVNVREGATLSSSDKIVQLSTCMDAYNRDNTRYLVTGVLIDDQQTY